MFDICLLGTGGMAPMKDRALSSMILRYNGTTILVDCGEGTQVPLQSAGWGFKDINTILFTHYHGDHITGLPGILYQMINANRTETLTIMGPDGIEVIFNMVSALFKKLPFQINYVPLVNGRKMGIGDFTVENTAVSHTVPCYGYSFEIKRLPKFDPVKAKLLEVPVRLWRRLQNGGTSMDVTTGRKYTPDMVLGEPRKGLKVTYSTDTRPCDNLIRLASDSDLFIGEGMYGDNDDADKAKDKGHSTFAETAEVAKQANVKELWLTHYSPALVNPDKFYNNGKSIFPNIKLGKDLMQKVLRFEED